MLNCLVLFDAENQFEEIAQLKSWELNANFDFLGFTIKDGPNENELTLDFSNTALVIVIIGESTKFLNANFNKAIREILKTDISILCLNTDGFTALQEDVCPKMLADAGCIHMPFTKNDAALSLKNMKPNARAKNKTGSFHYKNYLPDPLDG